VPEQARCVPCKRVQVCSVIVLMRERCACRDASAFESAPPPSVYAHSVEQQPSTSAAHVFAMLSFQSMRFSAYLLVASFRFRFLCLRLEIHAIAFIYSSLVLPLLTAFQTLCLPLIERLRVYSRDMAQTLANAYAADGERQSSGSERCATRRRATLPQRACFVSVFLMPAA